MVQEEMKEKKEAAEEKVAEIKASATETKEAAEEKAAEVQESAIETKEEAGERIARGRSQAEKMLNDFFNTIRNRQEDFSKTISEFSSALEKPLADIMETDDEIIVKADLPGVEKGDIDVNLTEDSVEIMATFKEEYSEEDVDFVRRERSYGETRRYIALPAKVKVKDATANFENSVLTITLPKLEGEKFKVSIK